MVSSSEKFSTQSLASTILYSSMCWIAFAEEKERKYQRGRFFPNKLGIHLCQFHVSMLDNMLCFWLYDCISNEYFSWKFSAVQINCSNLGCFGNVSIILSQFHFLRNWMQFRIISVAFWTSKPLALANWTNTRSSKNGVNSSLSVSLISLIVYSCR